MKKVIQNLFLLLVLVCGLTVSGFSQSSFEDFGKSYEILKDELSKTPSKQHPVYGSDETLLTLRSKYLNGLINQFRTNDTTALAIEANHNVFVSSNTGISSDKLSALRDEVVSLLTK